MASPSAPGGRWSLAGKLSVLIALNLLVVAGAAAGAASFGLPPLTVFLVALAVAAPVAAWSLTRFWRPVRRTLQAVTDGVRSFRENDFSVRLAAGRRDELGELVALYNRMGDALRLERNEIYQRELLLDTLLQGAPMGILLVNELDRVVFANLAARELFGGSARLAGRRLADVAASSPEAIGRALYSDEDTLFTVPAAADSGEEETYRLVRRRFQLNTQDLRLLVLERMTPELRRQEVEVWKKVIRVMNHELNNSLAPVSSLLHSARHVAGREEQAHRLDEILGAAEERVQHLSSFLEGYARFARLPPPRRESVAWPPFLEGVQRIFPFRLAGALPAAPGWFDPGQIQQVLINLLKNASESGGSQDEIRVAVEPEAGRALIHVLDRGKGMDDETMRRALLPFYSSKESGRGLGLALCTEILSAHGGSMRLRRRPGGGTAVTCVLPAEGLPNPDRRGPKDDARPTGIVIDDARLTE